MTRENSGCQLPEELRRYYLEVMGIQVWTDNASADAVLAAPGTSSVAVAPAIHPVVTTTPAVSPDTALNSRVQSTPWQLLETEVAACTQCVCHQSRSQTVLGSGHPQVDVLIIGEAPDADEEAQGRPFVARTGDLLDAMLLAIGLQREQVYLTNIVKCRPPQDRAPQADEVMQCTSHLHTQIELLQPKVIFAMGKQAAQYLLASDSTVGALRESQHEYQGIPLLVTYHPDYLLRKPTEKRKAWQDLLRLKALLN